MPKFSLLIVSSKENGFLAEEKQEEKKGKKKITRILFRMETSAPNQLLHMAWIIMVLCKVINLYTSNES